MNDQNILELRIWGQRVGALSWIDGQHYAEFQYDPEFVRTGLEISPLMMPLAERIYRFPALSRSDTFLGLPGLLADSLTEKYGNTLMRKWLARKGILFSQLNPLERLCYIGSRGMGALEFRPDKDPQADKIFSVHVDELVRISREIMEQQGNKRVSLDNGESLKHLIQIGTSAGGAKAKAIIAWNEETNELMSGQAECEPGFEHWLIKFSGVENSEHAADQDVGRLEYAYYLMAVQANITMMQSRLLEDNGEAHFMTRRFDRIEGQKIHVHTFCGIAHADRNPAGNTHYEMLFTTARKIGLSQLELDELYRRMVFNIMARNQDDHSKNHAFLMDPEGRWVLSPAYDLVFSYKKGSRWVEQQQMCCNGKRDGFTRDDLYEAARAGDIKQPDRIIQEVRDALSQWEDVAHKAGLKTEQIRHIRNLFRVL